MVTDFFQLAHPSIRQLKPYVPGKPISELQRELGLSDIIKLASNENPLGPSPLAIAAATAALKTVQLYPDGSGYALKQALSQHLAIKPAQITLGSASDNIIALILQAFTGPDTDIIVAEFGFGMYSIIGRGFQTQPIMVKSQAFGHDLKAMALAITPRTKVIFIANPNNPTGTWNTEEELTTLLESVPSDILVVVDEAYFEYVNQPTYPRTIALQQQYDNLIILRTFSKAYGLAGLRIGYGISHPDIADIFNRIRLPFNINAPAEAAAIAALSDQHHVQQVVALNLQEYQRVTQTLTQLGLNYIPSVANFVTIEFAENAEIIFQSLLKRGIIVRPLTPYNMPRHLRVSIGTPEQNERLLNELSQIIKTSRV
ncbi:MAG: histidinol-phosphate transaminase [Legionellales bacterium]|nr:histidinol-phosphate transaminase [Legionellales bacterium]